MGSLQLDEIPSLMDQIKLADNSFSLPSDSEDLGSPIKSLPSLDLGVKVSFTTRQWRERERKLHRRAIRSMQSPVRGEIRNHQMELERNKQILSYGQTNKAKAIESQLKKIRQENRTLAQRLVRVQETVTEITATNQPGEHRHVRALKERKRYLSTARRAAQSKLDAENKLLLKRIVRAKPTVQGRTTLKAEYNQHKKIKKNMCKLTVPPDELYGSKEPKSPKSPKGVILPSISRGASRENGVGLTSSMPVLPQAHGAQVSLPKESRRPISRTGEKIIGMSQSIHRKKKKKRKSTNNNHPHRQHSNNNPSNDKASSYQLSSNEDRGQICHEWVEIRHILPGLETPVMKSALLIGFKKPNERDRLIFEVSMEGVTRYADVSYSQMKAAIDNAAGDRDGIPPTLSQLAAQRLSFFGTGVDIALVWKDDL